MSKSSVPVHDPQSLKEFLVPLKKILQKKPLHLNYEH
jgi:hypothetical protein